MAIKTKGLLVNPLSWFQKQFNIHATIFYYASTAKADGCLKVKAEWVVPPLQYAFIYVG